MSINAQNRSIARLIIGAMSIDGSLSKKEQQKIVQTLDNIGMGELIADVGAVIEDEHGDFNVFQECRSLRDSLGTASNELLPLLFRVICDVVASDRFVSLREASYLSAVAKRLEIPLEHAQSIFKTVMAERRGRLEIAGKNINDKVHANLKELLSFKGAEELVGELDKDSIEEMMHSAEEGAVISQDEVARALAILGLKTTARLEDAENVWRETIDNIGLSKMADLGETFVSAAINRLSRINEAYKTILQFHEKAKKKGHTVLIPEAA